MKIPIRFREQTQTFGGNFDNREEEIQTPAIAVNDTKRLNVRFRERAERFGEMQETEEEIRIGFRHVQTLTRVTDDYGDLKNKPSINEHELASGENSLADLRIGLCRNTDIDRFF